MTRTDSTNDKPEQPWMDAARTVLWAYDRYANAKTPIDAARSLSELNDGIQQLVTWLPEYDDNRGWLVGEGDDA